MEKFMQFFEGPWRWVIQVFVVIFATLLFTFIFKRVLNTIGQKVQGWRAIFIQALWPPLNLAIWTLGFAFAGQIIEKETGAAIFAAAYIVRKVGIIFAISWFLMRLVKQGENTALAYYQSKGKPVDKTTTDAVGKILRASIVITTGLVLLQTLGFSISGLLAFGGIGGIAIGFAAKDLLANFFGAFMLYWDRPFQVGDWIRSPDREIEGTVEHIGWRLTSIRTFDKRLLYVPNAVFSSISVENPSRMSHRRIYEKVGIRYADSKVFLKVLAEVREMLINHPEIDEKQTLMVNFDKIGETSLEFFIYTFTHTTVWTRFHEIKEEILMKIYEIIEGHGAEVAFPTSTVQIANETVEVLQTNSVTPEMVVAATQQAAPRVGLKG